MFSFPIALLAYLIVAAGLLAAVHRRRPLTRIQCMVLLLIPFVFMGKALLLGAVYAPVDLAYDTSPLKSLRGTMGVGPSRNGVLSDVYSQMIPWHAAVRAAIFDGQWPLWNPYLFAGDVLAASAQPAPYYPFNLLSLALPFSHALTFLAAITLFLAGLGAFLFAREVGCSGEASLFAAAAWALCDFLSFWLEWPMGVSVALMPLVLLATHRLIVRPGIETTLLLGGAFVLLLLAGHPETALHIVVLAGLYALFLLRGVRHWWSFSWRAILAGVLSVLLCAFFLFPIIEALPQTWEYGLRQRLTRERTTGLPWNLASRILANNAIPFVSGVPEGEISVLPEDSLLPSSYAGSIALALAALGILNGSFRQRWPMLAFVIVGVLTGAHVLPAMWLLETLPLLDITHNQRLVFAAAFGLSMLAAFGLDRLLRDRRRGDLVFLATGLVLAFAVVLFTERMRAQLTLEFIQLRAAILIVPLFLAAIFLRLIPPGREIWLLLGLLAVQRNLEAGGRYPTIPRKAFYPVPEELKAIPRNGLYRMTSAANTFVPNVSAVYGLEDVRAYQAMTHRRWFETSFLWSRPVPIHYNRVDDLTRPFLSFLNVRYAMQEKERGVPEGWKVIHQTEWMFVLENTRVLERAFIPRWVRLGTADVDDLHHVTDFRERVWISAKQRGQIEPREIPNGTGTVSIRRWSHGFRMEANMNERGWIVVSETDWIGWKATIDGKRSPLFTANHAFLAIDVPQGRHLIELRYFPDSFAIGLGVSAATATMLIAFLLWRRKKRHASPSSAPI